MNSWLEHFSPATLRESVGRKSQVSGFPASSWGAAQKLQIGDWLFSYMVGGRGFFGIAEITAQPYFDDSPRWQGFGFAVWVPRQIRLRLSGDLGLRPPDMPELSWIKGKSPAYWRGRVRRSLTSIAEEDAQIIAAALYATSREST